MSLDINQLNLFDPCQKDFKEIYFLWKITLKANKSSRIIIEPNRDAAIDRVCRALINSGLAQNKVEAKKLFTCRKSKNS